MAIFTGIATALFAGTALAGTFAVGATAFALQMAAGLGLSLIAQAIAGKKSPEAERAQFSVQGRLQAAGDIPRSFILGWGCTAGSLAYANTWEMVGATSADRNAPNGCLTQVIALSDLPVQGLSQVWVNGEMVTLDGAAHPDMGFPVLEYRRDGKDHLWVKFYDGTQTTADPFLVNTVSSAERPYAATRVGVGVAYAICTARVHEDLFAGGFPTFKFAVNGLRLYDPSRDSTMGGAGPQRWLDPSTWGGDGDHLPAVQIYNLLRGISFNGEWFYGLQGMAAARVPVLEAIDEINKCRAGIDGPSGLEPTYRTGGEIHVSAPLGDAIEALLTGCQGHVGETGGTYKMHVGEPGAPSFAFSDADILSTEEQSFTPFFGLADTVNGITAKHPSPEEAWATKVAPPLYRSDLEALAGNRRLLADVALDLVPYPGQVQRLMKSALAEAQRARRHTLVLPPQFWSVEPGDIVAWTSVRNGYVDKLFRVDGVVDRANLDVMVDLTEVDPSDYDWDQEVDYRPPAFAPIGPIRPPPQPMVGWQVFPAVIEGDGGRQRPSIEVRFDGNQDDVSDVWVQARLASNAAFVYDGQLAYGEPSPGSRGVILNGVFLSVTHYQVRGRFLPFSGRRTEWSEWLDVVTDDIGIENEIGPWLDDFNRRIDEQVERVRGIAGAAAEQIADLVMEALAHEVEERAELKSVLVARTGALSGAVTDLRRVVSDDNEVLAQLLLGATVSLEGIQGQGQRALGRAMIDAQSRITRTENGVETISSLLLETQTAIGGSIASTILGLDTRVTETKELVEAQANALLLVESAVGNVSAQGLFSIQTAADQTGAQIRMALRGRTNTGQSFSEFGFYGEIVGGVSRIALLADRVFVATTVSGTRIPLVEISAGQIYLGTNVLVQGSMIVAGTITAERLVENAVFGPFYKIQQGINLLGPPGGSSVQRHITGMTITADAFGGPFWVTGHISVSTGVLTAMPEADVSMWVDGVFHRQIYIPGLRNYEQGIGSFFRGSWPFTTFLNLAPGNHTIEFWITLPASSAFPSYSFLVREIVIVCTQLKKAVGITN